MKSLLKVAVFVLLTAPLVGSQTGKPVTQHATTSKTAATTGPVHVPPFDKLELFAFLAAGPFPPYAAEVIHDRKVDFEPDDPFLRYYPFEAVRDALDMATPVEGKAMGAKRKQAFEHFSRIAETVRDKKCTEAELELKAALELAPDSASLHYAAASCQLVSHNWQGAEKELRESVRLWPGNSDAHGLLGYVLSNEGQNEAAIPELRESLRIFPTHQGTIMLLGLTLARTGKYEEAIPVLKQSAQLNQKVTYVEKMLGFCYVSMNDPSDAIDPLAQYVLSDPDDAEAHFLLGSALKALGKKDEARTQFQEAARLEPRNQQYRAAAFQ
ncbi:MAG TPA: tetratricopeptide repeat protein [Candidatus Saccharimonadales bacterium]|nr:tetratricopeptide repeat protein [Candidatus Saccharimonadales bacterium]